MNSIPVLKSKLIMPELPANFLLTGRLKMLHQSMDSRRAVTICAPAGYGKTTLVVSYLNCRAAALSRICWYRLEPDDRNLSVFVKHLAETVFPAGAAEFAEARKAIEDADLQLQPQHALALLSQEMWTRQSQTGDYRTCIVLDDFQNVAQATDISDMTRFMLDHLPPSCAIYLLNRTHLKVFTEKQKLENNILEIGTDDLAFSKAEIEELIHSMHQTVLGKKLAADIAESTEGWIAGIMILCQAVKSKGPGAAIEPASLDRDDALFRYLSMEVLNNIESSTQDTLARLALLHDFSEDDAMIILGIKDIQSFIKKCIDFGMFIQRIPGNPLVYRFHPLFREFLLSLLKERFPAEQIDKLHLQAANYYIEQDIYGRAAEHIAQCGNVEKTMNIVTQVGIKLMMVGERGQLKAWLDMLPDAAVSENPVLLIFKALMMPQLKYKEAEDILVKALEVSQEKGDLVMQYRAATSLVFIYFCSNNMAGVVKAASSIPRQSPETRGHFANTLNLLEMMQAIGTSMFSRGFTESAGIAYTELAEEDQWLYLAYSCVICYCLGKLDDAERCVRTALSLACVKDVELARGTALYLLSTVLALQNKKDSLLPHLAELEDIGKKYDYIYFLAGEKRLAAFERYLAFDTETAVEMLDNAVILYHRFNNRAMSSATKLLRCLWAIGPGYNGPELDEARQDVAMIRKLQAGLMVYETSLSVLGAIYREAGDYTLSEKCLLSSIQAARGKKESQVLCGSCFHIARLYFANDNREQGHRYLKQAVELAAKGRYFMFWDIHMPTIVEMALRSIRYGYAPVFAEELLGKFFNSSTTMYLVEKIKTIDESRITSFSDTFVSGHKEGQGNQYYLVKASLFGSTEITVNGVKIPESEWKTKKNKGLLEYLLLSTGKTVSKETLAGVFWPESDSRSASVSLRTALYRLRKTLNKYNVAVSGDHPFIDETPEGLLIRKNEALELDLHEFLQLYHRLAALTGQPFSAEYKLKEVLEKMVSLYHGELIETSDYGDSLYFEREKCKSIFEEACLKLSSIYILHGELRQAEMILKRALTAEPYSENACLELLKLYMSQGTRSKAVRLYNSFKKRYQNDLHLMVDKRLTEVIQQQ